MSKKLRLDSLIVENSILDSREKAKRLILARKVTVNGNILDKCGTLVPADSEIKITEDEKFVGRGGYKIEKALKEFKVTLEGKTAIDSGASTGGFTDCLLQNGIEKVFAIDVGYGQLAWKIRSNPRVKVIDRTNVRYLKVEDLGEKVDFVTLDLSFISLRLVLENIYNLLKDTGEVIALIKPQFEVGKGEVEKGGIIKSVEKHKKVVDDVSTFAIECGFFNGGVIESPISGTKGNIEYLIYLTKTS